MHFQLSNDNEIQRVFIISLINKKQCTFFSEVIIYYHDCRCTALITDLYVHTYISRRELGFQVRNHSIYVVFTDHLEVGHCATSKNSIEKTTQPGQNLVIAEDFNRGDVDWDSDTVKPDAYGRAPNQKLLELVKNCSLANVQQQAIRGGRALYVYFTTNPSLVKSVAVVPGMSDHEGMAVIISDIRPTYSRPKPRIFFIFSKANCDQIQKDTAKFIFDDLKNHTLKISQYKLEFNSKSGSCNVIKICTI